MRRNYCRNTLCQVLTIIMISSVLAGCVGTSLDKSSEDSKSEQKVQKNDKANENHKTKELVTMWGWDEGAITNSLPLFNKKYPNIEIEFVAVKEYVKKVQTTVASGTQLPDILWGNMAERGIINELNILDDLTKAPYNFDTNMVFDFGLATSKDSKGQVVYVPWDIAIGAIAYRKDLARKYLGTDDSVELTKMMPDWDSFIEKGKEVKKKSRNTVFMFAGLSDFSVIRDNQFSDKICDGNKFNFSKGIKPTVEAVEKIRDAGIADKIQQWSPAWNASFSKGTVMFYPCPMWGARYLIELNDKDGKDNWGLMECPGGSFNWGGSAMGVNKNSNNKEAAWKYIEWFLLSKEGADYNKDYNKYLIHYKPAFDDENYKSIKSEMFGDLDLGKMYIDVIAPKTKLRPVSKYDTPLTDAFYLVFNAMSIDLNLDSKVASEKIKEEFQNKYKDIQIE